MTPSKHKPSFMDDNCAVSQKTNPSPKQNKNITWWRSVGVGGVLVEVAFNIKLPLYLSNIFYGWQLCVFPENEPFKNKFTWWRSVGVGGVLVEVGGVEVVLDLRRDRRVDGPVAEAFPVEAVEPPETIIKD